MKSGEFEGGQGTRLYGDWYPAAADKPRGVVVVAHGYDDHCGRYQDLAKHFSSKGFACLAFDYRGHGKAGGARGHCDRFEEYLADLEKACGWAAKEFPGLPIALFGHSHGSLIILRSYCQPGFSLPGVQSIMLSAPYLGLALKVPALKISVGKIASNLAPRLALKNDLDLNLLSHDPAVVDARRQDRLTHGIATARWFTECTAAQEYVVANVGRLAIPSLWLVAGADGIADPAVSKKAFEQAGGDKTLRWYDDFFHEVLLENGRERVYADIDAWLLPRFSEGKKPAATA